MHTFKVTVRVCNGNGWVHEVVDLEVLAPTHRDAHAIGEKLRTDTHYAMVLSTEMMK